MTFDYRITPSLSEIQTPLVTHVPHSSLNVPPWCREQFVLNDEELERELLAMTDRYTDELFVQPTSNMGGASFVNHLSRLVFDPERFEDDNLEPMASKGMGAVYTRTSSLSLLRADV